jgi:hypothetical protein
VPLNVFEFRVILVCVSAFGTCVLFRQRHVFSAKHSLPSSRSYTLSPFDTSEDLRVVYFDAEPSNSIRLAFAIVDPGPSRLSSCPTVLLKLSL